jgi:hypothetical protein
VAKEAICCATHVDGLVVMTLDGKTDTQYVHFGDMNPKFAKHLRIWGEAGTVMIKGTIHPKLKTRGETCMVVGYAPKHTGNIYCMWNPDSNQIHKTRDITWLNRYYFKPDITIHESKLGKLMKITQQLKLRMQMIIMLKMMLEMTAVKQVIRVWKKRVKKKKTLKKAKLETSKRQQQNQAEQANLVQDLLKRLAQLAMDQFDDANFVEQDDNDEDRMCEPEQCYFDGD